MIARICAEPGRVAEFSAQFGVAAHADTAALQVSLQNAASVIAAHVLHNAISSPTLVANKNKLRTRVVEVQALTRTFEVPPGDIRGCVGHIKAAMKYQLKGT